MKLHSRGIFRRSLYAVAISFVLDEHAAHAQLSIRTQFAPGAGSLVGAAFDASTDRIWVYGDFATDIRSYSGSGIFLGGIARPGEGANDTDLDFATEDFTMGTTMVPAGSLLFVNGETGAAEVYAVNKQTGAVIATLPTTFGTHHVVGGAYHRIRNTLYLIDDKLDPGTPNTIAEINPGSGAVIRSFGTGSADYTINYGDIEVSVVTGNLFLVSSDEASIRELTADGVFVRDIPYPAGVSSVSGIALDDARDEAIVSGTGGTVWILSGLISRPVLTIRQVSPTEIYVCWNADVGKNYNLQRRSSWDAGSAWSNVITGIYGPSAEICRPQALQITDTAYYYRLEVIP